jgi:hypothetical protein
MISELLSKLSSRFLQIVVGAIVFVLLVIAAYGVHEAVKDGREVTLLKIISLGPKPGSSPAAAVAGGKVAAAEERAHRKILYVKVTYLSDKSLPGAKPFYRRVVSRLKEPERSVDVYDEAVYYTLELLPEKRAVEGRRDNSSGVVDSSLVIPWRDEIPFPDSTEKAVKEMVMVDVPEDTDTFLTVSHFENGLQGKDHQDLATKMPEGADYVRLVVDFSSVPGANVFVSPRYACVSTADGTDGAKVGVVARGESVYTAVAKPTGKGQRLKMYFDFDWSKAPAQAFQGR